MDYKRFFMIMDIFLLVSFLVLSITFFIIGYGKAFDFAYNYGDEPKVESLEGEQESNSLNDVKTEEDL